MTFGERHEDLSPTHVTYLDQPYFFIYSINCMRYNNIYLLPSLEGDSVLQAATKELFPLASHMTSLLYFSNSNMYTYLNHLIKNFIPLYVHIFICLAYTAYHINDTLSSINFKFSDFDYNPLLKKNCC